jgi:hypothetical protein
VGGHADLHLAAPLCRGGGGGGGGYAQQSYAEPAYDGGYGGGYEASPPAPAMAAMPAAPMGVMMGAPGGQVQALIPVQLPNGQVRLTGTCHAVLCPGLVAHHGHLPLVPCLPSSSLCLFAA